jgi:hypothetical protein
MVDILQAEGISRYYHVAWADDADGTNFSLTEYDGALMIGTYNDDSGTESTDPADYVWQIIGAAESGDGDPATAAAENEINALTAAVDDLTAKTITNAGNIDRANASSVEGIGQPNLLSGTNRGADGWTGSGFTLAAETGTVYNETDTPITWLKATCVTPGALSFSADGFRAILAEDSDTDTYTLSFDMRQSVLFDVNVTMSDADGTNTQIDFGTADSESDILEDLRDMAGAWTHQALTAQIVDGNTESAQVLLFDCSAMTAGETVEIANLKIEGGAIATPWKASADEAMNAANEALSIAGNTNQYFWHTETGTDTGAHITEIPKDDFLADPTHGGGNLLARSNGIAVRDGLTELATFGASGAQIGQNASGKTRTEISTSGLQIIQNASGTDMQIANLGYGQGYNAQGQLVDAPFYTLGTRSSGSAVGNYSTAEGYNAIASRSYAHAEGDATHAVEHAAHAEGAATTASGKVSHAEGVNTTASGDYSHAEGYDAIADGDYSHAQNHGTEAGYEAQTAIGKYNDNKSANAFEIGNGTSSASSNALEVTWAGDLTVAGEITDGGGNVLSNKADLSAVITPVDYVIEQAPSGNWRYRKWHSGRVEAWFNDSITMSATTAQGNNLYRRSATLAIPSGIFTIAPGVIVGSQTSDNTIVSVKGSASSATSISITDYRTNQNSSTQSRAIRVYAWQNP